MGRRKKNLNPDPELNSELNPNQNPNPPNLENADSVLNQNPDDEIIVEGHSPELSTETDSTWEKIKNAATRSGLFSDEEESGTRVETRGRKKKTAANEEFATLIISVLILILSFSNIPEDIKPNNSELRVLANHLSGLMLRHLPISSKFSQDSLDVIGIMAVISGWYARVSPAIKKMQTEKAQPSGKIESAAGPAQAAITQKQNNQIDPIERLSPATARFLDEVERKNNERNS